MEHGSREFRRRKYLPHKEKQEKEERPLKILSKPKEGEKSRKEEDVPTPVILLKNKDASKPSTSGLTSQIKGEIRGPIVQPKPRPDAVQITRPPVMRSSVKLIDFESMTIQDGLVDYLTDSTDFLVVGCLGLQGVGKSTLLSDIAFPPEEQMKNRNLIFKAQTKNHIDSGSHYTEGVDAFITSERIILLDTMPVFSLSVLSRCQSGELGFKISSRDDSQAQNSFIPNSFSNENDIEIMALQTAAFLFAVCHVVIVVQDYNLDADFMRFLQTAEMLKPSSGTRAEDDSVDEFFPHCVFVHNQARQMMFDAREFEKLQDTYKRVFSESQLHVQSGCGIGKALVSLSPEHCGEPINLFILPNFSTEEEEFQVAVYEDVIEELRAQILGLGSPMLTHVVLTEKNWYHYAVKIWEDVKRSQLFSEYSRLLPSPYVSKTDP